MIKSYFKIAWRNLLRNKAFSSINILGLSCGISVSLLMFIHIRHELSYETFFPDHELIYRVGSVNWAKTPPTLAPALKSEMPQMETTGRFYLEGPQVMSSNDKQIPTQYNYLIDPSILSVFRFTFIHGKSQRALDNPNSIIITRDVANKLFGDTDPTGQVLKVDDLKEFLITGVIENIPFNSHLKIETLISISGSQPDQNESHTWKGVDTYVRFRSSEDAAQVAGKLKDFGYRFLKDRSSREDIDRAGDYLELHPIASIHLYSHREKEMGRNSDIQYVYVFAALAIFIILIASINFVNLFTAQSVRRMKEIGIKKVVGASRTQLFRQFFLETFLMTFGSVLFALILTDTALPFYNQLSGLMLTTADLFSGTSILILVCLTLTVAGLSGFYPSLVISNYRVAESLKNKVVSSGGVGVLRRVLVTFQFMISCLVIILTVVAFRQISFMHSLDLGFVKERVVTVKLYGQLSKAIKDGKEALKNELLKNHNIKSVSISTKLIGERFGYESYALIGPKSEESHDARYVRADDGFVPTLGLTLVDGTNFLPGDTLVSYILNEEAVKQLAEKDVVGKLMGYDHDSPQGKIVGIVKDFNYASLHNQIEPLVIECRPVWPNNLLIRVNDATSLESTLEFIKREISTFAPGSLVIFNFMDDQIGVLYETENKLFGILKIFALLSVIIATLGLVALSAHTVESRVKEIGIRKVLGATVSDILLIFSTGYIRILFIASIISIPLAYSFADSWLSSFAFHTPLSWWIFVFPGIGLVLFTTFIISVQSLKPAMADPVKSLRYE